jgi:hypothetical protein
MPLACSCTALGTDLLNSYLGKSITEICPHGYDASDLNHCAHFVCHVMNLAAGSVTCRGMSGGGAVGTRIGVCIRVHELFAECPQVSEVDSCSNDTFGDGCFVFVTRRNAVNLAAHTMTNVPKKHVGIGMGNTIWHYSNTQDRVVTTTPELFIYHYSGQTNGLFRGTFSDRCMPTRLGCGL